MMARPKSLRTCNTEHEEHRNVPKVESRIIFFQLIVVYATSYSVDVNFAKVSGGPPPCSRGSHAFLAGAHP